jgi:hypothetical protein
MREKKNKSAKKEKIPDWAIIPSADKDIKVIVMDTKAFMKKKIAEN